MIRRSGWSSFMGWCLPPLVLCITLVACTKAPITGRSQLNLVSDSEMNAMANQEYANFLKDAPLSKDQAEIDEVKRVGTRIAGAVEKYLRDNGMSDEVQNYKWEFNLVESEEVNAWCMPGGKVVVYSGLLPVAESEAGLAVVMGHEIAHAVAKHGAERMSQGLVAQMGGMALSAALAKQPAETQSLFLTAFGVGAQVGVLLPYGRTQESEADHLGLVFMAMAGYNPDEAVTFWQRMMAKKGDGGAPPEFLSTHPSDKTRIEKIQALLPEVRSKYYKV